MLKNLVHSVFNYKYLTGYYVNSRNKMYHLVYDFAWLEFLDGDILILRRKVDLHPKTTIEAYPSG